MRVVIADDVMLTRAGISRLLSDAGVRVVAEVGDSEELMRAVATHQPDVAVIDIRMPPTHTDEGLVAARSIRGKYPEVGVLVLSQYVEPVFAMQLLEAHPERSGYLLKERVFDVAILLDALQRVDEGDTVIDSTIVSRLVGSKHRESPLASLTSREQEVLTLIAEGLSNRAIADRIYVSERTVENHVTQIFMKLQLPDTPDRHRRVLAVVTHLRSL
jgi:DNA-binding NarL/FixJ family response regulator